ncbi:MAG: hypothetical protein NZ870_01420 [bacterium]|nr:hypothetical protein [bacterium]
MKNFSQNKHKLFAILFTLFLSFYIKNSDILYPGFFNDDAKYLLIGEAINNTSYKIDYLINRPQRLQYPPIYPIIVSISLQFKDPIFVLRIINTVILIFSLIIIYSFVKSPHYYYAIASSALLIIYTNAIMPELLQLLLTALLIYTLKKETPYKAAFASAITTLLFYTKTYGIFVIVPVCIYLKKLKQILTYLTLTTIFITPWFLIIKKAGYISEFVLYMQTFKLYNLAYYKSFLTTFKEYFLIAGNYSIYFSYINYTSIKVLLAIILLLSFLKTKKLEIQDLFTLMHMLLISLWITFEPRYIIPIAPYIIYAYFRVITTKIIKTIFTFSILLSNLLIIHRAKYIKWMPDWIDYLQKQLKKEDIVFAIDNATLFFYTRARIYDIGITKTFDHIYVEAINYNANNAYIFIPKGIHAKNPLIDPISATKHLLLNSLNTKVVKKVYEDYGTLIYMFKPMNAYLDRYKKINEARNLIAENNLTKAKKILENLVKTEDTFLGSFLFLLRIYEYENDLPSIKSISRVAINYFPMHPEILYFYSYVNNDVNILENALRKAEAAGEFTTARKIREKIALLKTQQLNKE